jgi:hypothetical protein
MAKEEQNKNFSAKNFAAVDFGSSRGIAGG